MKDLPEVADDSLRRMRSVWPATRWDDVALAEYRGALLALSDAGAVEEGVTRAIREWDGRFAPPIGWISELVRTRIAELRAERRAEAERTRHKQLADIEVAPRWWARMIVGTVIANAKRRGYSEPIAPHLEQYVALAEHTGVLPDEFPEDNPARWSTKVVDAIEQFHTLGVALGDEGDSDRSDLTPLIGPVRRKP
jgi:hypothetical protein